MNIHLALIGGEEFSPGFEEVHATLLAELDRENRRVVYLPTCAAEDGEEAIEYWCTTAREHLTALGALVETPQVVTPASPNDPHVAQLVAQADWIYFGGGYPHVAMRILAHSLLWEALRGATSRGALISGSSGGAMLLCARSLVMTAELQAEIGRVWETGAPANWDPPIPPPLECLGFVPHAIGAPHFNRVFPASWLERGFLPPGWTLIGIDEQTVLVQAGGTWQVRGRGAVTIIDEDRKPRRYAAGEHVTLRNSPIL